MLWKRQSKESAVFPIILQLFLVIFSTTTSLSFTKLKIILRCWTGLNHNWHKMQRRPETVGLLQSSQFSSIVFLPLWLQMELELNFRDKNENELENEVTSVYPVFVLDPHINSVNWGMPVIIMQLQKEVGPNVCSSSGEQQPKLVHCWWLLRLIPTLGSTPGESVTVLCSQSH